MTRSEACEILGISENASAPMARAAYKMLKDEAASATEKKVLATALNAVLGNTTTREEPVRRPSTTKPRASASTNRKPTGNGASREVRAKGTEVARKSSTAAAKPAPKPVDTRFDHIKGLNASVVQTLPTLNPSRTFERHIRKGILGMMGVPIGPNAETWTLKVAPDERSFLQACSTGLFKWDIASARITHEFRDKHTKDTFGCDISPDGLRCVGTTYDPNRLILWDYSSGKKMQETQIEGDWPRMVAFRPNSTEIICVGYHSNIVFWDYSSNSSVKVDVSERLTGLAVSSDGNRFYTYGDNAVVKTWDAEAQKVVGYTEPREYGEAHSTICVSPDGSIAITTPQNTWWNLTERKIAAINDEYIDGLSHPDRGGSISPDGKWAITPYMMGAVLWDMSALKPIRKLSFPSSRCRFFTFSPSADFVIGSAGKRSTYLWRL